jgi:hypothetical protein
MTIGCPRRAECCWPAIPSSGVRSTSLEEEARGSATHSPWYRPRSSLKSQGRACADEVVRRKRRTRDSVFRFHNERLVSL